MYPPGDPPPNTTDIGEPDGGCLIGTFPDCVDPNAPVPVNISNVLPATR